MSVIYEKADNFTLRAIAPKKVQVEQDHKTEKITTSYDYSFLLKQREAITKQRDAMIRLKEDELKEVELLIKKAEELGLKEKTEEEAQLN